MIKFLLILTLACTTLTQSQSRELQCIYIFDNSETQILFLLFISLCRKKKR